MKWPALPDFRALLPWQRVAVLFTLVVLPLGMILAPALFAWFIRTKKPSAIEPK